jgi:hypothetical protein
MKRSYQTLLLFMVIFCAGNTILAQSKLTDAKQSALTGLSLPEGSKLDKRMMSVAGAKLLLEMVSKKAGVALKNTEVLYLLPEAVNHFNNESFKTQMQQLGWNVLPVEGEPEYYWLEQNGRYILAYYLASKKETNIYFADASQAPANIVSNNGNMQPAVDPVNQQGTIQQTTTQETSTQQTQQQTDPQQQTTVNNIAPAANNGYAFTTTNFDDGWNSTVQEDWVEVTKGNIKVLLHYPKEGTIIPADPEPHVNNAWNILTAPRYSNLRNYRTAYITTYNRPYLGIGTATENATGSDVFVVLFRQGQTGWLEFITPDKNTFIQQFRFDPETIQWDSNEDLMKNLSVMGNYNKFAVAASDFTGVWTSDFSGMQQLYNVYTGNYAGMHINQSRETFEFIGNGSYNWKLLVVNGMVGSMNTAQVQSTGQIQLLNNWQVSCTDIEGKPKKYHAFFSCIKGARLLNLLDADFPGSGIYTVFGRK